MRLNETIERPREAAAQRVRKPRRAVKVATMATRTIYRTGRGVGRLSARRAQPIATRTIYRTGRGVGRLQARRAQPISRAKAGAAFAAGAATGAGTAYLFDPADGTRRRHVARDKLLKFGRRGAREAARKSRYAAGAAKGAAVEAAGAGEGTAAGLNDPALARKVESEIFRDAEAPKGQVNVNVVDGVVELRGAVDDPAWAERLESQAKEIEGVRDVRNLITTRAKKRSEARK
jgi:osmotically-inducible protein OsmY